MSTPKEISNSKAAAAGMAYATLGRNRVYGSAKRPQIDDSDEQIDEALEDEDNGDGEYVGYIPIKECKETGFHCKSCDNDGFFNVCGDLE